MAMRLEARVGFLAEETLTVPNDGVASRSPLRSWKLATVDLRPGRRPNARLEHSQGEPGTLVPWVGVPVGDVAGERHRVPDLQLDGLLPDFEGDGAFQHLDQLLGPR